MNDLIPINIYKDPLTPNKDGFGYMGCLLQTKEEDKLQCHICGELHSHLSTHLRKHGLRAREYRKRFGLCWNTPMISRAVRERYLERYLKIPEEKRNEWRKKAQQSLSKVNNLKAGEFGAKKFSKSSLEFKNKTASCPDQIIEEIKRFANEIGKTPTVRDFILLHPKKQRYVHLAKNTFGTWGKALEKCGLEPNIQGDKLGSTHKKWDRETLIEFLQVFTRENNRIPRTMDCFSGELPTRSVFQNMFGGLEKARQEAGVYELVYGN